MKELYPFAEDVKRGEYTKLSFPSGAEEEPDFIGGKPNYDKFDKWGVEETLVWLNID